MPESITKEWTYEELKEEALNFSIRKDLKKQSWGL